MLRFLYLTTIAALVLAQDPVPLKVDLKNKVIGGSVATPNSWPYQVSLRSQSGVCYNHNCGGVLIKKQWVLTAAQCVDGVQVAFVVLGDHDQTASENPKEQFYGVSQIYIHPSWNRNLANGNDIALIRLTSEVVLNSYVQLATLPPSGQILSTSALCYVTGWGVTQNGAASNVLKQASLPIVDYATCSSSTWWGSVAKTTMICAGGSGTNAGCSGDGGGPLSCLVGGNYVVHGVFSFVSASGCNTIRKPNGFTRVSAYTSWIQGITG